LVAEASLPAVQALAASHYVTEATVTVLLKEKRISPASETKPGKAPKNVDYIGVFHLDLMMR
jgi:translation initiation factor eIF-2B subunit gamma